MADKILGYELDELVQMINTSESRKVRKALNYLDGKQEEELITLLNDGQKGRADWKNRGFIPRYRNLVKPIVTHSGMLFKDALPQFSIFNNINEVADDDSTSLLMSELSKLEFEDTLSTLDIVVRLTKTALLLVNYNNIDKKLEHIILHRGNSAIISGINNDIIGFVYKTGDDVYRVYTQDTIIDFRSTNKDSDIIGRQDNPFGIIPVVPFYDTECPLTGLWQYPGMDLINANEQYNMHLTDSEFALSWAKMPTLYTNCDISSPEMEVGYENNGVYPTLVNNTAGMIGGPGKVIKLDSLSGESPFVEYKAPTFDITSMDKVQQQWLINVAQDWSVALNVSGSGHATSGFQLIVEEMPNLELRKQRQKMFNMGFKRWYRVVATVLNTVGIDLPLDSELIVEFRSPKLPFEAKDNEEIWDLKIESGRASRIDYFKEEYGLTTTEAELKLIEIDKYNNNTFNNTLDSD